MEELHQRQIDADQAWEFLLSKSVPNLDIERPGMHKVTLVELIAEFRRGILIGADDGHGLDGLEPAEQREGQPTQLPEKRCTLCGSPRFRTITGKFAACTLIGCKDPLYDYRLERQPESGEKVDAISKKIIAHLTRRQWARLWAGADD